MKPILTIFSIALMSFSSFAATKAVSSKVAQVCHMKIMNSKVTVQVLEPQYHLYTAEVKQNGTSTLQSNNVKVSIRNVNDLSLVGPGMALSLLQQTLSPKQINDINFMYVYDIEGSANEDDGSGAMILEVTFKSTSRKIKLGQVGWGYGVCR